VIGEILGIGPSFHRSGPGFALAPLLKELFGLTDDQYRYVYLSDGGHFDNLGLYEMVRRRCRLIVVVDGSEDAANRFKDLGNAVRKIRIDFGIPIVFKGQPPLPIYSRDDPRAAAQGRYCAVGQILYTRAGHESDGTLIYLKPTLLGSEPADVIQYANANPAFPHEATTDQWFTESQFESYRALGMHVVDQICARVTPCGTLARFAEQCAAHQACGSQDAAGVERVGPADEQPTETPRA
jgi:hypothetical protein